MDILQGTGVQKEIVKLPGMPNLPLMYPIRHSPLGDYGRGQACLNR